MARKKFNFLVTTLAVIVQKLAYADPDAPATVESEAEFLLEELPAVFTAGEKEIALQAYGLSQFLQDRTTSFSQDEKLGKMAEVFANLKEGKWREERASSAGPRKASIDVYFATGFSLFLASKGKDIDVATATSLLQDMEADQRKALRADDRIKPFVEKAKEDATAAASELDLADLLS